MHLYPRNRALAHLAAATWFPYGDLRHYAHSAHPGVRVGEEPSGPVARPAVQTADAGYGVQQWHELGDIVTFPPVKETASGVPCGSTIRWCLLPGRARSTGESPV